MCAQDVEIGVGGSRNRERVGEIRRENGREGGRERGSEGEGMNSIVGVHV